MNPRTRSQIQFPMIVVASLLWMPVAVSAQAPLLEVDKGELKLMQVNDDGGLVARGVAAGGIPESGPGIRLMWFPAKFAFRVGVVEGNAWDLANVGAGSFATGINTMASGDYSTALGASTRASAYGATALGNSSQATGRVSTAMGDETKAIGERSTAMGFRTTATDAYSTVLGSNAGTFGGSGSFVYGDASTETALVSTIDNEFVVRAAGGFRLRTSPDLSTGCDLAPGAADWACTSSRLAKENFENVDAEAVLGKLAAMRIQGWRYIGTKARHVGPVAEDFYAAFGLGQGPTTISTMDIDGISLTAIQALERRTVELRAENTELRRRLEALEVKGATR